MMQTSRLSHLQRLCAAGAQQQMTLIPATQRDFGANEKQLKIRMKSVNSIRKITKAMKMVAAAKMKGDLNRLEHGKNFGHGALDMMFKTDLYMQRRAPQVNSDPSMLIVPLSSDKGMCGSINSGVVREVREFINQNNRNKIKILSIGDKGASGLARPFPDCMKLNISDVQSPINYPTVMAIGEHIVKMGENSDKIIVYYNEFKSAISTIIRQMELMPRKQFLETMKFAKLYNQTRPDKNTSNPALYELYVTSNLWLAFLNNAASEQSARMNAMENASKNAKEILEGLTLKYNQARQARITMELVEIISGASAL